MTPDELLREAVEAMRNVRNVKAEEWRRRYPHFAQAVDQSPFATYSRDPWDSRVSAMNTELQLRIAESLLASRRGVPKPPSLL